MPLESILSFLEEMCLPLPRVFLLGPVFLLLSNEFLVTKGLGLLFLGDSTPSGLISLKLLNTTLLIDG